MNTFIRARVKSVTQYPNTDIFVKYKGIVSQKHLLSCYCKSHAVYVNDVPKGFKFACPSCFKKIPSLKNKIINVLV